MEKVDLTYYEIRESKCSDCILELQNLRVDAGSDLGHLLGLELHMRDRARGADGAVELRLGGKAVADDIR